MRRKSNRRPRASRQKLTLEALRKLVISEVAGMSGDLDGVEAEAKKTEEVDAEDLADTIENDVDHYKELKLKEMYLKKEHTKLVKEARKVRAKRNRLKKQILRKLK